MLEARHISVTFDGVAVLDRVSVSVQHGCIMALVGPNGAGKTTLLEVIMGVVKPCRGMVWYRGQRTTGLPPWRVARMGISYMPQFPRPFKQMKVIENMLVATMSKEANGFFGGLVRLRRRGEARRERAQHAQSLLSLLQLSGMGDSLASELSYGQMKRLTLAQVLAGDPDVFLLDEPSSGLDRHGVAQLLETLSNLKRRNKGILLVEHDLDVVKAIADHVVVLEMGKVIQPAPPTDALRALTVHNTCPEV